MSIHFIHILCHRDFARRASFVCTIQANLKDISGNIEAVPRALISNEPSLIEAFPSPVLLLSLNKHNHKKRI
jgi:hypothetical protein